jgi:hypothetical protein
MIQNSHLRKDQDNHIIFPRENASGFFKNPYESQNDGFIKSSPAAGGTRRAKTEE